ncbi:PQQ-dependent sugar dehydrogenase [Lihuaxuella thermophila]|uniref:Glucose/arabinose dehydrogenase, beta-propeller fold n=1 Tax=Lihuaxuella thermophila TaxID=1173111 RepID=A0A1H8EHZ8_9BACL|nr:PQQ-dependent sugar dehydrogenase [Lihuaxuella thermophila]SEN19102.1 Glucose/arabinose dehydrogenase, beta-propeller fold [Lihuaxuella thermophila]
MIRKLLLSFLFSLLILSAAGCTPFSKDQPVTETEHPSTILASDLQIPWSIAKAGSTFYITERPGNIVKVQEGRQERKKVILTKAVYHEGEGGLLGLALSPDFHQTANAYVYHTYLEDGEVWNRLVLVTETDRGWVEQRALLEKIPGSRFHNGGRIKIGPDQHLYVTTGDAGEEEKAQDLQTWHGKILRMTLDGKVPPDNPFPHSYVYSYGHRNPQGLSWSTDGVLYSSEHGPSSIPGGHDELNRIEKGKNYGWPEIIGDEQKANMLVPLYHSGDDTWAPSGISVYKDAVYAAGLRGQQILKFSLSTKKAETIFEGEGRLRDIYIEDGVAYVLTNNTDGRGSPRDKDDRLLRIQLK